MEVPADIKSCNVCGVSSTEYLTCKGCLNRVFCCLDHQKVDWRSHKHGCLYNPDRCGVCGKREGLQCCAGCLHRKYCCVEHQKEAWKDHKTICNVYQKLKLSTNTDPEETATELLTYSSDILVILETRSDMVVRVNVEVLAMTKHFGLKHLHLICILGLGGTLLTLNKFEEAEIFARDGADFAREVVPELEMELSATGLLASVLLHTKKFQDVIGVCDYYLELRGTEDSKEMDTLRGSRGQALSLLGRHEEALDQLSYVYTSKHVDSSEWHLISEVQKRAGQLTEAAKSMKKANAMYRML
jgi:hypothetical protein